MADHACPLLLALGNGIELLFHFSREVIVHDAGEVLHQEIVDNDTDIRG